MAELEFQALVNRLAERTAIGKVNWKPTASESEYVLYFKNNALSMRRGVDDEDDEFVVFTLRNDAGKKIDEFRVWDSFGEWRAVADMWASARRRALKLDEALEGLLMEIETKDIIGDEAGPKQENEDDLPF